MVPAVKVQQIVKNHTTFSGPKGLYTQTFGVVMNKASYQKLAPDLRAIIDRNSGSEAAALFGRAMDSGDKRSRDLVQKAGNNIITLDAAETARWQRVASGTRAAWYREVSSKGLDGQKLANAAEQLINEYSKR